MSETETLNRPQADIPPLGRRLEVWSNGLLLWRSEPFEGSISPPLPYDLESDHPFEVRMIDAALAQGGERE